MKVRARFTCHEAQKDEHGQVTVRLSAVQADNEECKEFWEATPAGSVDLTLLNPQISDFFVAGRDYYVDFGTVPGK